LLRRIASLGDVAWLHLIAAVCWLLGAILVFCAVTISPVCHDDDPPHRPLSQIRYEQNLFLAMSCEDEIHRGTPAEDVTEDGHPNDAARKRLCEEMRRIAEKVAAKYHPKGGAEP